MRANVNAAEKKKKNETEAHQQLIKTIQFPSNSFELFTSAAMNRRMIYRNVDIGSHACASIVQCEP